MSAPIASAKKVSLRRVNRNATKNKNPVRYETSVTLNFMLDKIMRSKISKYRSQILLMKMTFAYGKSRSSNVITITMLRPKSCFIVGIFSLFTLSFSHNY